MACGQRAVLAALLLLAAVLVEPSAGGGANTSLLDALAAFPGLAEPPAAHAWVVDAIHVDAGPLARAPGDGPVLGNATAAFVRVDGKRFMLGCKQFMPVGWNSYTMLEQAAQLPVGSYGADYSSTGRAQVVSMLDTAHAARLNFMRVWAFTVTAATPLQLSPSTYDNNVFRGLDFILDEAYKRGIYVTLVLGDWWTTPGGVNAYTAWSPTATCSEDFFSDPTCIELYKRNALNLISRTNSINGRRYRDDPTIFAWELLNEPRCRGCQKRLQTWIEDMAAFLAEHDPNHLRSIGEEGFFSAGARGAHANPAAWAQYTGQDFYANHMAAGITHAAVHVWPVNWAIMGSASGLAPTWFVTSWLTAHIADADRMGKPLILEEFGASWFPEPVRDGVYGAALSAIETSVARGNAGCGVAFWTMYSDADRARTSADPYAVFAGDAVFGRVAAHASTLAAASKLGSCGSAQTKR